VKLLLDTHALIFLTSNPSKLSSTSRQLLKQPTVTPVVSSASAWEITTKHRLGKLPEAALIVADWEGMMKIIGAQELSVSSAHALLAGGFSQDHKDPFDRLLAAQSILEGIPLVSNDPLLADFPVTLLW
jgi:PIN domain nuclease of toxin-antitoxin system